MSEAGKWILQRATDLRRANPQVYGIKGAARGTPGYVPGGWKLAVEQATQQYYQETNRGPSQETLRRKQEGTIAHRLKNDEKADQLYRTYRRRLEQLKKTFWNYAIQNGINTTNLRALKPAEPKKNKQGTYVRKRLPLLDIV